MLDQSFIGYELPSFTADVEKGRLRFFAKAIGETNPIYTDEDAAVKAGYRTLPAPPTFAMVLDMDTPELMPLLGLLKMDIGRILHGSQEFEYFQPIYAGDQITVTSKVVDIFDKKGGALDFVVTENSYTNQDGDLVAKSTSTLVHRNG
ncbi:MAG TPA: MaoC family dehydratase [Halieaceae bacterium]|nr:MAG: MaoC family dehydratase [Gammaproteobacteria bacterium]HDY81539.1 MaoC family dehydratase [Halieaceae bacterium]